MDSVKNIFGQKVVLGKKDYLSIAVTVIYALITLVIVVHHEPYEDEVNVWMILHNLEGLAMWRHIVEDGNPPGFFLLLMPLVKSGLSFLSVKLVCWFSCVMSVFLLNRFSPFPWFLNLIITFSAPMLYIYPAITRCYSILPLLIILAAVLHPNETERADGKRNVLYLLVLAAIAQNHVIMFAFAGLMLAMFVYRHFYKGCERRPGVITAAFIVCVALAAIVVQCFIAVKTNSGYTHLNKINSGLVSNILSSYFSGFSGIFTDFDNTGILYYVFLCTAVLVFCLLLWLLYKAEKKSAVVFMLSVLFPFYIYVTRYSVIQSTRVFIAHFLFVFFFWLIAENKKTVQIQKKKVTFLLMFLFLLSVPGGMIMAVRDFRSEFSGAENMAFFIKENVPDDGSSVIVSLATSQTTHIAYYLYPRPLYSLKGEKIRYIDLHPEALENRLMESGILNGKKYLYVIFPKYQKEFSGYLSSFTAGLELKGYKFIYETPPAISPGQDFLLYRIP